jgi:hypothetical protein
VQSIYRVVRSGRNVDVDDRLLQRGGTFMRDSNPKRAILTWARRTFARRLWKREGEQIAAWIVSPCGRVRFAVVKISGFAKNRAVLELVVFERRRDRDGPEQNLGGRR